MMSLPSSLILSILLLTAPSLSTPAPPDDGMWHPAGQVQASTWAATAANPVAPGPQASTVNGAGIPYSQMTVPANDGTGSLSKVTAPAVSPTVPTPAATGDWQTAVTWPAGCELWANPCPAGAHVNGGATVPAATVTGTANTTTPYENGFTSYTSMTDANGVITGMPAKATIAAGVTGKASNSTTLSTKTTSSTGTGSFSQPFATKAAAHSNGAATFGAPFALGAFAVVAALL
ncbi:hypothetical protein E2P81_ATG09158 [Venturia nashicola]|uniref:Uncharacterized protein n=1 Tax=Venturia nashicola TaxID=86259 RepID=A0A4Z1P385_9PEZI|nr:hypothetical protein E6O75_ATG09357 [Venturia nashicola]TLD20088.1 hypothetical protein E2P81_ATG09158 [Venturia nashicola]